MSDPCEFLTPTPAVPDGHLRQQLLDRTLGVLRRRRGWRCAAWAATVAASFAAGVFTMLWLRPVPPPTRPEVTLRDPALSAPEPPLVPDGGEDKGNATTRSRQLILVADHCLTDRSDPLTALHGYGQALDEGGPEALTVSAEDSYLLIAIKNAREKEKRDANHAN